MVTVTYKYIESYLYFKNKRYLGGKTRWQDIMMKILKIESMTVKI